MKRLKKCALFLSIALIIFLPVSTFAYAKDTKTFQIKGSDTMVNLGQAWAEEFMYQHPDASIAVTGGGSGTGIAAILSGTCDLAQSSRSLHDEELKNAAEMGHPITETVVGLDAVAVIVHPSNPVTQLDVDQLSAIFTGKIKNWKELGGNDLPILVLSRERNSGTHVFFLEEIVRRGIKKATEEYSHEALMMPSNQSIVQEVKSSEGAIGYIGLGYVSPQVKVLDVAKSAAGPYVHPDLETAQSGEYPISRPLLFLTSGTLDPVMKDYMDFVLGPDGQEIVKILDFVPLKNK
ncbi:MAG: phosphate ABC transporter substrate-binding protein [Candidatus Omnitrophica bacterium]|nr:phosphate ABC transporter substrate-binding protein [Candidatus Omnitrophota bacterium]